MDTKWNLPDFLWKRCELEFLIINYRYQRLAPPELQMHQRPRTPDPRLQTKITRPKVLGHFER